MPHTYMYIDCVAFFIYVYVTSWELTPPMSSSELRWAHRRHEPPMSSPELPTYRGAHKKSCELVGGNPEAETESNVVSILGKRVQYEASAGEISDARRTRVVNIYHALKYVSTDSRLTLPQSPAISRNLPQSPVKIHKISLSVFQPPLYIHPSKHEFTKSPTISRDLPQSRVKIH